MVFMSIKWLFYIKIIYHVEGLLGACHGGVNPLVGFLGRIESYVSRNMNIDILPLSALRLMAGDSLAEHTAKSIEIWVF